jgi:hypothetical protein
MIYSYPDLTAPIRQGDIFIGLPRIDLSLAGVLVLKEGDEQVEMPWEDIAVSGEPVTAVIALRPVAAIVANQDCDTIHGRDVTLCEIRPFRDVERSAKDISSANAWMKKLTQHARVNLKWFYLPSDTQIGFTDKMAVDFMVTLRVARVDLERLRQFRKARLNDVADEHFRERIAEFFRRYPYDEWYPLNQEELVQYKKDHPEAEPFPWQNLSQ